MGNWPIAALGSNPEEHTVSILACSPLSWKQIRRLKLICNSIFPFDQESPGWNCLTNLLPLFVCLFVRLCFLCVYVFTCVLACMHVHACAAYIYFSVCCLCAYEFPVIVFFFFVLAVQSLSSFIVPFLCCLFRVSCSWAQWLCSTRWAFFLAWRVNWWLSCWRNVIFLSLEVQTSCYQMFGMLTDCISAWTWRCRGCASPFFQIMCKRWTMLLSASWWGVGETLVVGEKALFPLLNLTLLRFLFPNFASMCNTISTRLCETGIIDRIWLGRQNGYKLKCNVADGTNMDLATWFNFNR